MKSLCDRFGHKCECGEYFEDSTNKIDALQQKIDKLRDTLSQMDLTLCSMGDLMTKEDMDEVLRLEALRDRVLEETK